MDQGKSELNASSLIDLKAELHKKYESFRNVKINQNNLQKDKGSHLKIKGNIPKEKNVKRNIIQAKEIDSEEDLALRKSREALEAKAKLYDKIVSNNVLLDEEEKDNYLVDFQRKVLYNNSQESSKPETNSPIERTTVSTSRNFAEMQKIYEISSKDKEEDSTTKRSEQDVHYQNIHYNEVRDHGTSYFSFSTDESKRKEQMEELSAMRQETEEQRHKNDRLHMKRKSMLQARLKKICARRNIDQSVLQSHSNEPESNETETLPDVNIDISAIPLPEVKSDSQQFEKKLPKIRPWDIGKNNLQHFIPEKRMKTQNQWVEDKREERPTEFAPPSFYNNYK